MYRTTLWSHELQKQYGLKMRCITIPSLIQKNWNCSWLVAIANCPWHRNNLYILLWKCTAPILIASCYPFTLSISTHPLLFCYQSFSLEHSTSLTYFLTVWIANEYQTVMILEQAQEYARIVPAAQLVWVQVTKVLQWPTLGFWFCSMNCNPLPFSQPKDF